MSILFNRRKISCKKERRCGRISFSRWIQCDFCMGRFKEIERCIETEEVKEVERCIEPENIKEEKKEKKIEMEEKINSLFNQFSKESEVYVSYNVYIVRDGDTLESIIDKYATSVEELKKYNDLSELKLGDKLIIPNSYERD